MRSAVTQDDTRRWCLETDCAGGSRGADYAFPPNAKGNKDGGKLPSFCSMFFASVKSIQHLSAVRGHMHNHRGVFAINLLFEFHLE